MKKSITKSSSPSWTPTTKLIVGLTIVAIVSFLLIRFRNIIGPLALSFILAYLFHPLAGYLSKTLKISWRAATNLIYIILLIIVVTLFTITGFAITQQLQSLIGFVQRNVANLPEIVTQLSNQTYQVGPFHLSLEQFDLQELTNSLLSMIQSLLGRAGSLLSTLAASAAVSIGWGLFVLVISYFLLTEAGKLSGELVHIDIPGYHEDILQLNKELAKVWNSFLRGQLMLSLMVIASYYVLMMVMGMRFALGIAILAGLGRFVPYLGPLVLWIVTTLVALFQGGNYFGLLPYQFAILVVVSAMIMDQIFDNLVTPRFFGETLGVHPAAVLITAIVAANLIGIIGLLLAAPGVATMKLLSRYVLHKMFDLEPFPEIATGVEPPLPRLQQWLHRLQNSWQRAWQALRLRK